MRHIPWLSVLTLAGAAAAQVGAAEMTGKEVFEHYCSGCHAAADGPGPCSSHARAARIRPCG